MFSQINSVVEEYLKQEGKGYISKEKRLQPETIQKEVAPKKPLRFEEYEAPPQKVLPNIISIVSIEESSNTLNSGPILISTPSEKIESSINVPQLWTPQGFKSENLEQEEEEQIKTIEQVPSELNEKSSLTSKPQEPPKVSVLDTEKEKFRASLFGNESPQTYSSINQNTNSVNPTVITSTNVPNLIELFNEEEDHVNWFSFF